MIGTSRVTVGTPMATSILGRPTMAGAGPAMSGEAPTTSGIRLPPTPTAVGTGMIAGSSRDAGFYAREPG